MSASTTTRFAEKQWRLSTLLFLAGLAILAAVMFIRASYGMEWLGDDGYTIGAATRYAMGDRPIIDAWETHFSSDMVVTPTVWVIRQLWSDNGLVRHYRYVFVLFQLLFALGVWRLVRGLMPPPFATLTGWVTFVYLPYYYLLLNYNSMMIAAFTLSMLLLFNALSQPVPSKSMLVASGLACAFGIIVYPTMVLALPFFILPIWIVRRDQAKRAILWFLGAVGALLLAFALLTLVWAGTDKLAASLYWFIRPGDRDMSFAAIFARFNRTRAVIGASLVATVVFLALRFALANRRYRDAIAISAVFAASALTAVVSPLLPHSLLYYMDIPQAAALGAGLVIPLLCLTTKDEYYRKLFWLLYLPFLGLTLGAGVASLEGFETASMPAIVTLIAGVLALVHALGAEESAPASKKPVLAGLLAIAIIFGVYVATDLYYYGGDQPAPKLTGTITEGAYAGIHTTPENVARYNHLWKMLLPLREHGGTIAAVEAFPSIYLISGLKPAVYSVWSNFTSGPRWQAYLDITGNYPDYIVSTRIPGPNGGLVAKPFAPPMGIRDFGKRYVEIHRERDYVIYSKR